MDAGGADPGEERRGRAYIELALWRRSYFFEGLDSLALTRVTRVRRRGGGSREAGALTPVVGRALAAVGAARVGVRRVVLLGAVVRAETVRVEVVRVEVVRVLADVFALFFVRGAERATAREDLRARAGTRSAAAVGSLMPRATCAHVAFHGPFQT